MVFVQENHSMSTKEVLRGLHIPKNRPQEKFFRVIKGSVFDIAVDVRKGSSTYRKWYGIKLSEENKKQFYISEGFAYGFYVMTHAAELCYKVTNYWYPNDEIGIPWDDTFLDIR